MARLGSLPQKMPVPTVGTVMIKPLTRKSVTIVVRMETSVSQMAKWSCALTVRLVNITFWKRP